MHFVYQLIIDNPRLFDADKDENLYDDFAIFTYRWIEYAQEELSWNKKLIGAIIADGRRLENKQGDVIVKSTTPALLVKNRSEGGEDNGLDCTCSMESDWCSGSAESYQNKGCIKPLADRGCGSFYTKRCTGRCHYM